MLAGMPPIYGLYAGLIPLLIYAFLGTSGRMSIGPVAVSAILVVSGVGQLAEPFSDRYVELVIVTGLLVGLLQIILSFVRMGFLINFLSHPVVSGFISGAAVIIIVSQIKDALGISIPRFHYIFETISYTLTHITEVHILTAVVCLGSIVILVLIKKWKKSFPAALFVVIIVTALTYIFRWDNMGLSIIKDFSKGCLNFLYPILTWLLLKYCYLPFLQLLLLE